MDPAQWPTVMHEICQAVGAEGAALLQADVRTPDVPVTEGVKEFFSFYFREGWHEHDLRVMTAPLLLAGRSVVRDQDLPSPDVMRTDPFYNDCIYKGGLHWFAGVGIHVGSALWAMTIQRTTKQGPFEDAEMQILAPLSPLLSEVAILSNAVARMALSSSTNTLDAVSQPAIAIDHFGLVLDANCAAQEIFDADIHVSNRRLFVGDPQAQHRLDNLLLRLAAAPETATLPDLEPIAIRHNGRQPIILRALPVPLAARSPFLGARAILTLTLSEMTRNPDASLLIDAFNLTAAEAKLAARLAGGRSLESVADELGISRETARTQLKATFAKTSTRRQSELVALLMRLGGP